MSPMDPAAQQIVLNANLRRSSFWLDERCIPLYAAALSLLTLAVRAAWLCKPTVALHRDLHVNAGPARDRSWRGFLLERGGITIFLFKAARLAGMSALLWAWQSNYAQREWREPDACVFAALLYASFLALCNVLALTRRALVFSLHLTLVSLAALAVYAYRDIWPLMTFTLQPKDGLEGDLLWVKLGLLLVFGTVLPLFEPYPYIPYNPLDPAPVPGAEQTASVASFLTYVWLDPVIWRAHQVPHLPHGDLPPLCDYDQVKNLIAESYPNLDPFSGGKPSGSLFWGLARIFRHSILHQAVSLIIIVTSRIAVPIGTNRLLAYLETGGQGAIVRPWVWILCLVLGPLGKTLFWELYQFISTRSLARLQAVLTGLVFDHALRIRLAAEPAEGAASRSASPADSAEASDDDATIRAPTPQGKPDGTTGRKDAPGSETAARNLVGRLNNLVTSDLENIGAGREFLFVGLLFPLQVALAVGFLYAVLGWSSLVGLATMLALAPAPSWVSARSRGAQSAKMSATDARVQRVSEAMGVLRTVKLLGWEARVSASVAEARDAEMRLVWRRKVLDLVNLCVVTLFPLMHMIATYGIFTIVMKQQLTASIVFSSLILFDVLRRQMGVITFVLPSVITANVSLNRIADFLHNTELLDAFTTTAAPDPATPLALRPAAYAWSAAPAAFRLHVAAPLPFPPRALSLVVGPTGAGKTAVLLALLGELRADAPGAAPPRARAGGVAYAAQEAWVLGGTIRENIVFGAAYDAARYARVVYQCGLTRDLGLFEAGDATEVGERGVTLSGGQKARVTLARAVYSFAETLLLDDVLAALDVHTARWIVDKCFKGDLIRGRTVVLVTHNVAMAAPVADFVVSLRDGRIVSQGTINEVLKTDPQLAEEFEHDKEAVELDATDERTAERSDDPTRGDAAPSAGKLVVAEEVAVGRVGWKAYKLLLAGLGGAWPLLFWCQFLGADMLSTAATTLQSWWLGHWAQQYALRDPSDVRASFYLGMYVGIVALTVLAMVYSSIVYTYGGMRASRVVHAKLVKSLLGSTFRWLDVTPTSRVITRCTQDIQAVDGPVPTQFAYLVQASGMLVVFTAAIVAYTPMFLLPALALAVLGVVLGNIYIKAQLAIKREMSNAKAPVLDAFSSAMSGLASIRAYAAQEAFRATLHARIDGYTRAARSLYNVNRWICMRLDILGHVFSAALAVYLVYYDEDATPSSVGFLLSIAALFSDTILWWVCTYNDFEVSSNSLERIQQYLDIEHEPEPEEAGKPPAYWPSSGELRVEKLSARYSENGPTVLQDISFEARAGERIGIVGRTGSGKSTLTLAILRCIYTEGSVIYDGIPTDTLNLDALRASVTIIPQVPELLGGTLRHNLDPAGEHADATLHDALRAAGLFSLPRAGDAPRLTLDAPVAGGGANLSGGQRQIVALARAIVRQSRLLVLDEATSAIDYETDAVIQASLRTQLGKDVTVVTVAHRLQTVMDYDKILVLDAGRLVECDTPKALLHNADSLLRALVEESADRDALYAMAEGQQ